MDLDPGAELKGWDWMEWEEHKKKERMMHTMLRHGRGSVRHSKRNLYERIEGLRRAEAGDFLLGWLYDFGYLLLIALIYPFGYYRIGWGWLGGRIRMCKRGQQHNSGSYRL